MSAILESTLTCPTCGTVKGEIMPTTACQYFYECTGCKVLLKPKPETAAFFALMDRCLAHPFSQVMMPIAAVPNRLCQARFGSFVSFCGRADDFRSTPMNRP